MMFARSRTGLLGEKVSKATVGKTIKLPESRDVSKAQGDAFKPDAALELHMRDVLHAGNDAVTGTG